jgi:hypothetical protein
LPFHALPPMPLWAIKKNWSHWIVKAF